MLKYKNDIAVIGIGRFGSAVVNQLLKMGRSVVLIDSEEENLRQFGDLVSSIHVVDATDINTLKRLGIHNLKTVIVGAPNNIEIVATLLEMNVTNIMARATNDKHARVLKQIGVNHIILPELEAGTRTALIAGNDNVIRFSKSLNEISDGFVMGTTSLFNAKLEGKDIKSLNITRFGVSIVLIKSEGKTSIPMGNTVLKRGDQITMIGQIEMINQVFAIFNRQKKKDVEIERAREKIRSDSEE